MTVGQRAEPFLTSNFAVQLDQEDIVASFAECSGLEVQTEVYEYQEGGRNDSVHKLPGRRKHSNLILKRGMVLMRKPPILWAWCNKALWHPIERKHVTIILYNHLGEEKMRWNFDGAYPVKWSGTAFKADENAVTIESLELIHQGMYLDAWGPQP